MLTDVHASPALANKCCLAVDLNHSGQQLFNQLVRMTVLSQRSNFDCLNELWVEVNHKLLAAICALWTVWCCFHVDGPFIKTEASSIFAKPC
jgi:hypothetical protein